MKYLFVLGRNTDLSTLEVENFLKKEGNKILKKTIRENGLLVTVDYPIDANSINKFGGILSIGEVTTQGNGKELFQNLEKTMIYMGESNKLTYTVWDFSKMYDECLDYLKDRFKVEKIKASYKGLSGSIKSQDGDFEQKPSSKLLDEEYFIFEEDGTQNFGKIIQRCDYTDIEKRDMEKPVRRESLAIAPRLAKILINIAGLKQGETMFDPFCGIGGIMQEALLQGINAVGSDVDAKAIKGAKENMKWFGFSPEKYQLINFDSTKVDIPEVNAIVTEPDLGDVLKKIPTKEQAAHTLKNFERLMIQVINNARNNVSGRVVFTSPYIRIGKKRVSCNIENICEKTGYSLVGEPIPEFRDKQVVGRMIYVLEKLE